MAEPAHVLIVQGTSVLALLFGIIGLWITARAYLHFSPGRIKRAVSLILLTGIITIPALALMVVYHIWDIELAQDLWHIFIGLALVAGVVSSLYLARLGMLFQVK